MTRSVRTILHTSDLHLDNASPSRVDESPSHQSLIRVVDEANQLGVDLMLIAGDLFDNNRIRDECLEFVYGELQRVQCPVVVIPGNHDCYSDDSVFHRFDPSRAGPAVHLLAGDEGETVDLNELDIRVWGRGIVDHHPGNQPMEVVPDRQGELWHVGITHGYYSERSADHYSSLITAAEIAGADLDYLALGHVHVFGEISQGNTCAAYSGSPGCYPGFPGGTAALVTLDPEKGTRVESIDLCECLEQSTFQIG